MIKLTRSEWNRMNRPVFPDIQFVSNKDQFQIQTMLKLDITNLKEENVAYYKPFILYDTIKDIQALISFPMYFIEKLKEEIKRGLFDGEEDKLYKVTEDGIN